MTLPLFLTDTTPPEKTFTNRTTPPQPGTTISLEGDEAHHAITVRRIREGEHILLTNGHGMRAHCEVTHVEKKTLQASVITSAQDTLPTPHITIVQALAKGGRDEQAVETCTEYGAMAFIPWQASRCVASWKGKEEKGKARWQATARAAAKQARRTFVPTVSDVATTEELLGLLESHTVFICHEEAVHRLARIMPEKLTGKVAVIVGPEGGISPEELSILKTLGVTVRLTPQVLRSASAGAYAIATIAARR